MGSGRRRGVSIRGRQEVWVFDRLSDRDIDLRIKACADPEIRASGKLPDAALGEGCSYTHGLIHYRDENVWDPMEEREERQGPHRHEIQSRRKALADTGQARQSPAMVRILSMRLGYFVTANGTIFVADGHGGIQMPHREARQKRQIHQSWGKKGTGPGECRSTARMAMDSAGRLSPLDRATQPPSRFSIRMENS